MISLGERAVANQSYLIQETVNKILDKIANPTDSRTSKLRDNTLAKLFDVSRTTVRTALLEVESKGIIELDGAKKVIKRMPEQDDYFDVSDQVSSKEEVIEKFFLNLINTGQLAPGDKFSELELAKSSGCNTISVREFLIKFSRFGIIDKKPRAKWEMVKFDEAFALELIEFRRILEMSSVTRLLTVERTDPVWKDLNELLDKHQAVLADLENRNGEFSELDRRLHMIIQDASGNRFFMQFFDVVSLICHYQYQWNRIDELERNRVAITEHIAILTNLLANNASGVIEALEVHMNTAKKTLLNSAYGLTA